MAFDGSMVACITNELNNTIIDGRILKIAQPENNQLLLSIKKDGTQYRLLISAEGSLPVIYLTEKNLTSPLQAPAFCMLLRKHLINGRIISITQPSLERIIDIEVEHFNEMGDICSKTIVVELMGKHSNIILKDSNRIVDSIKHVSALVSSVREVLPGREYFIPFDGSKYNPYEISKTDFLNIFRECHESSAKTLYLKITGISPILAEEILYRSGIDSDIPAYELDAFDREKIYGHYFEIISNIKHGIFEPNIVFNGDAPIDFLPFEYHVYKDLSSQKYESISSLLYDYYAKKQAFSSIRQKTASLRQVVQNLLNKDYKKYELQLKQIKDSEKKDKYKLYGELITAYGYSVPPKSTSMTAVDYNTGNEIVIPLDATLSAIDNGKKYFEKYSKMRRTAEALNSIIEQTRSEIDHLESISVSLDTVKDLNDIADLKREMIESGYLKSDDSKLKKGRTQKSAKNAKKNEQGLKSTPLHYISADGYDIYVGKNNYQNEYISFKLADGNDWWFHAKNIPGSHVIIKTRGELIPDRTFEEAASLAAHYSKADSQSGHTSDNIVEVDYIQRKYLKKTPGGKPGFVIYHKNYSMSVSTDISSIKELN